MHAHYHPVGLFFGFMLGMAAGISLWHFYGPRICAALNLHVVTHFRVPKFFR